ncbi:MAG: leucyl aminopeptidase [Erythrobacter sp.]
MTYRRKIASLSLASVIALAPLGLATPVQAQDVLGSGIAPAGVQNSAEREITFSATVPAGAALAIVTTTGELPAGAMLDDGLRDLVEAILAKAEFDGKAGSSVAIPAVEGRPSIMVFGAAGADSSHDSSVDWRETGGRIAQEIIDQTEQVAIVGLPDGAAMADAALGATLGQYRFDRYKSDRTAPPAEAIAIVGADVSAARAAWNGRSRPLAEGVRFARDLSNEPANVIYPASFIERTRAAFAGVDGVTIEVLDQADMRRLNMGAIAGVGQGSPRGSRLMMITYKGAGGAPIALAGKGITFDTGGISIKPNTNMWRMKGDMSGAAAVTGALLSLAKSEAPVHVVAAVALAENMPGANAQRPGDVVRTMSGKTIEILSTDAEGRLVLSDAIEYTVQEKNPFALVDIATLTGSVVRALGPEYAGVFARKDAHADAALAAAEVSGEALWRLPLHPAYRKAVKSKIADVKNSGVTSAPGASSGAHFVEYFVPQDLPWVHIDMASVFRSETARPLAPAGASGFGVMLLDEMARSWRPE